ncbi:YycH family regulatory protein [Paenibacillus sp. GCM10027627]|uniref:YycH family regulatory protein n=1 Tax=unclassified Paenibacillus TaxID=185978 RepID=UPI00364323EE
MIEKTKTAALIVLVALSLIQSYFLAYSMPGLGATVRSDQDYVNAEPLGKPSSVENAIFPEELIIHMGNDKHTVIYPGTQFYEMILNQRIAGREFKGFQRSPATILDWNDVRKNDIGIELKFSSGISVDLLQKLLKLEGDVLFLGEKIDKIWIMKKTDTEEIRTFFFSSEEDVVYESVRADLTVRDVQDYVGFGQHLPGYKMTADGLYIPAEPFMATELVYPFESYSPEQMQRSLFFDSSTTRAFEDRSGSQIFTDGKSGLKVEQGGLWISYTKPAATTSNDIPISENVFASVDFINQHGGWDGTYRLMNSTLEEDKKYVTFRKYIGQYPVIDQFAFRYGDMKLTLQQGAVTEYSRSTITLASQPVSRDPRWLQGGKELEQLLERYNRRDEIVALYPALKAIYVEENRMKFVPVWAVRLADGKEEALLEAYPKGYKPPVVPDEPEKEVSSEAEDGNQTMASEEKALAAAGEGKPDAETGSGLGAAALSSNNDGDAADETAKQ